MSRGRSIGVTASLFRDQRVIADPRPAASPGAVRGRKRGTRRRWPARQTTGAQRLLGLVIAAACALACGWYVHRVVLADAQVMTGTVTSTGVVNLNFGAAGVVAQVLVHVGEHVRKDQLLAAEAAPGATAIESADAAAVSADKVQLAEQDGSAASVAADRAQLARDEAKLAADQQARAQSRIVAPAAGVVTAVDAQPGLAAAPAGIADYVGQSAPVDPAPLFSLLPVDPEVSSRAGVTGSLTLPVIQLRTSPSWAVLVLVPESSAAAVRAGQPVAVSVPAAHLTGVQGTISEVLATPVTTAEGEMYEAIVAITSHGSDPPLDGMTANVHLKAGS
jgi:multidrug efflux pump subunit AcrA (membrane-fusion protein)